MARNPGYLKDQPNHSFTVLHRLRHSAKTTSRCCSLNQSHVPLLPFTRTLLSYGPYSQLAGCSNSASVFFLRTPIMNPDPRPEDVEMEAGTGSSIFRWETASGLGKSARILHLPRQNARLTTKISEHTCYACPTKANHPKARQSCYGIHSIPCYRYHPTMHAIGTSHNCFACIQADNQHHERHKKVRWLDEILQLLTAARTC